jgi:hypothetical protein
MILDFPIVPGCLEIITNYELYLLPNGIYRTKRIVADNYLYPVYFLKEQDTYLVSTSVYSLIGYKKRFIRNPGFQTTFFFRPTFLTIDQEVMRARTEHRRSTLELTQAEEIVELAAKLIQDYVTEIEVRFPGYVHILLMGGKDSENIILTKRKERWVVLSGEPNAPLNEQFIETNSINVEKFVAAPNLHENALLRKEIIASDCFYDVNAFRYVERIYDLVREHNGKVVLWMGSSGETIFSYWGEFHRCNDYFAKYIFYVGMAMGIWHQLYKNLFNIPVLSPYQSPRFLDELFYRFDPYIVEQANSHRFAPYFLDRGDGRQVEYHGVDLRPEIGRILLGRPVIYPCENPGPSQSGRNRHLSIPIYISQLRCDGIPCQTKPIQSWVVGVKEKVWHAFDRYSSKNRGGVSKVLVPLRRKMSKVLPMLRIKRFDPAATEIK